MSKATADLLRKAKARIGTPEKWHKGDYFASHPRFDLWDFDEFPADCPACAYGATAFAAKSPEPTEVEDALHGELPDGVFDVADFNDRPDTTHADVMALFDRAIAAEEATA